MFIYSCKGNSGKTEIKFEKVQYSIYTYKVLGLNESIIADSVWKLFSFEEIEELVIDKKDSLLTVNANNSLVKKT